MLSLREKASEQLEAASRRLDDELTAKKEVKNWSFSCQEIHNAINTLRSEQSHNYLAFSNAISCEILECKYL